MIEIFSKDKKKLGYFEGKQYLNWLFKEAGWIDQERIIKDEEGYPLLILDPDGKIISNENIEVGFIKDEKIYFLDGDLYYKYSKEKGLIFDAKGNLVIFLRGSLDDITDIIILGILTVFLEIHAAFFYTKYMLE